MWTRTIPAEELTLWRESGQREYRARIRRRGDVAWTDLSDTLGGDWLLGIRADINTPDQPAASFDLRLIRRAAEGTLSPGISAAPINQDAQSALRPLLHPGREVEVHARIKGGSYPWRLWLKGEVGTAEWPDDEVLIRCRTMDGVLLRAQITEEVERGADDPGVPLATEIQGLLDEYWPGADVPVLRVIGDPELGIGRYKTPIGSLGAHIRTLAQQIGWDVRYLWSEPDQAYRLTLYLPPRDKTTPDFLLPIDEVADIPALSQSDEWTRNSIIVPYVTEVGGAEQRVVVEDAASIAEYRRQPMVVPISDGNQVPASTAQATAFGNYALHDLGRPLVEARYRHTRCLPWLELHDVIAVQADGARFDQDRIFSVVGGSHEVTADGEYTELELRGGSPVGAVFAWWRFAGASEPATILVEYASDNQGSNASDTFNPAIHTYARWSHDGGNTWTEWFKIVGEDGASSEGRYVDFIFRTSPDQPPTPVGEAPAGWYDAPPVYDPEATQLWMSRAERDGATGALLSTWSVPVPMTGARGPEGPQGPPGESAEVRYSGPQPGQNVSTTFDPQLHVYMQTRTTGEPWPTSWARIVGEAGQPGEDGRYTDYIFRVSATEPDPPTGMSPAGWHDAPPPHNPDAGEYLWMSSAERTEDGSLLTPWSDPVRLTGERGPAGASVEVRYSGPAPGQNTSATFNPALHLYMQTRRADEPWPTQWARIVGEKGAAGDEGAYLDYRFRAAATKPATPTGENPAGWFDAPPDPPAGQHLWMTSVWRSGATDLILPGEVWSDPVRLTGPQGPQGQQGAPGPAGTPGLMALLTNDEHVFPADADGNIGTYAGAQTTIRVLAGTSDESELWSYSAAPSSGVTGTLSGRTYTVTGMTTDRGHVDLTATRSGYPTLTVRFGLSKARGGVGGDPATSYWLVTSASAIKRSPSGVFTPHEITVRGRSATGTQEPGYYAGRFNIATSTNGTTWSNRYTSASDTQSHTWQIPSEPIVAIRARLYLAGGTTVLLDEEVIPVVQDGVGLEVRYSGPEPGQNVSATFNPATHAYMQTRQQGAAWPTQWARIVGEDGYDGHDGDYRDFRFRCSETQPATPSGENPSGWFDAPPECSGSGVLWMSQVWRDGDTGLIRSGASWSTPVRLTGPQGPQGPQGPSGADGVAGEDGTSIDWRGEFASHPSNPQDGWAYRNTTDRRSYVYWDGVWYQMTIDGVDGQDGVSLEIRYSGPLPGQNIGSTFEGAYHRYMQTRQQGSPWPTDWARVVGERGADSEYVDHIFRCAATQPPTPVGVEPYDWQDAPQACSPPAVQWMATARKQPQPPLAINNYSETNNLAGWEPVSQSGLIESRMGTATKNGDATRAHWVTSDGNTMFVSDPVPVDPLKSYEVRLSHRYSAPAGGTWFVGVYVLDEDQERIAVTTFDNTARQFGSTSDNLYFYSETDAPVGVWTDVVGYLMASDVTDPALVPVGENALRHARLPSNARYVQLRYLNWGNNGTARTRYFWGPQIRPIDRMITPWSEPIRMTGEQGPQGPQGQQGQQGVAGAPGAPGLMALLSNDTHVLPASAGGVVATYAGANTTISVFEGQTDVSEHWSYSASPSAGVGGVMDGRSYVVTSMSDAVDTGYVDITATRSGYPSITVRFALSKAKSGVAGAAGTPGTAYWLVTNVAAIKRSLAGDYTPAALSVSAMSATGDQSPVDYAGRFVIAESPTGTGWVNRYSSAGDETSVEYTPNAGIAAVRVRLYRAGSFSRLLDEEIVPVVHDGPIGPQGPQGASVEVQYSGPAAGQNPSSSFNPATHRYMRVRVTGQSWPSTWSQIVGEQGLPGTDGRYIDYRFRVAATKPATPTGANPSGWSDAPPTYDPESGQKLWYSRATKEADGTLVGTWSEPVQLTGPEGPPGLSIRWRGESATPPSDPQVNDVYRDTDNGYVYIWTGSAWELMVLDGSDGPAGADGADGLSVFITYHDNPPSRPPATPTGNGTTGGWTTVASADANWISQKVASSASAGTWGAPILIRGADSGRIIYETFGRVPPGMSSTGGVSIVQVPGTAGGTVLQVSGAYRYWFPHMARSIPFDAETLYRLEVRARVTQDDSAAQQLFYAGVHVYDQTGAMIAGNRNIVASGQQIVAADGWVTYVAWLQGTGPHQTNAWDVNNPSGVATNDAAFIAPYLLINFQSPTNQITQVDYYKIEAVESGVIRQNPPQAWIVVPYPMPALPQITYHGQLGEGASGPLEWRRRINQGSWSAWSSTALPQSEYVPRDSRNETWVYLEVRDSAGNVARYGEALPPILPGIGSGGRIDDGEPMASGHLPFRRDHDTMDDLLDGTTYRRPGAGYVDTSGRVSAIWDTETGIQRDGGYIGGGASRARAGLNTSGEVTSGLVPTASVAGSPAQTVRDMALTPTQNRLGAWASGVFTGGGSTWGESTLEEMRLSPGTRVSMSVRISRASGTGSPRVRFDFVGTAVQELLQSPTADPFTLALENYQIPAGTTGIRVVAMAPTGGGATTLTRAMLNLGPVVLPYEDPPYRVGRENAGNIRGAGGQSVFDPQGNLRPNVGASDGTSVKLLPKGAREVLAHHLQTVQFEDTYENPPIVIAQGGATLEQREKWGTLGQVDGGTASGPMPINTLITQAIGIEVTRQSFTPYLYLVARGATTARSASFASPTSGITLGNTTGSATPPAAQVPSYDSRYTAAFQVVILRPPTDPTLDAPDRSGHVTVAMEVRYNGVGAWTEVGAVTVAFALIGPGASTSVSGQVTAAVASIDGNDLFRLRLKYLSADQGVGATLSVPSGALTWAQSSGASYASMTPDAGDVVKFFVLGQS